MHKLCFIRKKKFQFKMLFHKNKTVILLVRLETVNQFCYIMWIIMVMAYRDLRRKRAIL